MQALLEKFAKVKVLVVGDIMLDQYWWGNVERISPEAPVPIVHINKKSIVAGGAANVAANIAGLGAKPYLCGVTGQDYEAQQLKNLLNEQSIPVDNLLETERPTTLKTRIVAQNQQIVRIDQENSEKLNQSDEKRLWEKIEVALEKIDIVLISDYNKGVITENLCMRLITLANKKNKFVIVDPKGKDYGKYKSATILTPNHKEALEATNSVSQELEALNNVGDKLLKTLDLEGVIITLGAQGMTLFQKGNEQKKLSSMARKVYDVTGAGDTVISTLTVALGAGANFFEAARIANLSAGLVVEKVGTTAIKIEDLLSEISNY